MGLFMRLLNDMHAVIHCDVVFSNKKQRLLAKGWVSGNLSVQRNISQWYKRRQLCANR